MNTEFNILSFALEGEDLILARYFQHKPTGFYVDIGAYHPTRYSNTYLFYLKGWRGINIDATPDSMAEFIRLRPKDINLELAVGSQRSKQKYFCFEEPALNSFDESLSRDRETRGNRIVQEVEVECFPLSEILSKHIPTGTEIDFITIDAEGRDLDVLKTNDWQRFRPAIVLAECSAFGKKNGLDISDVQSSSITSFLSSVGYTIFGKTFDSVLFRRSDVVVKESFLDNGKWTPQTAMLRAIQEWVLQCDYTPATGLSIDTNPLLDTLFLNKWPQLSIQKAIFPDIDACNLHCFADDTFDLVYSHQVLEHIPKPWLAAQEMMRVLKPGGIGVHTSCAFNPRHGQPHFNDYYRFMKDGLVQLFSEAVVLQNDEWGNRNAILHNVSVDDGFGDLGGRRFSESIGSSKDNLYPWVTWIILQKNKHSSESVPAFAVSSSDGSEFCIDSHGIKFVLRRYERPYRDRLIDRTCDDNVFAAYSLLLKPGDVVFDVGSHIGRYSVYPSKIVGPAGRVYAFEPVEDNYWQLKVTLALNRCDNVAAFKKAIGNKTTETEINLFDEEFSSWSSLGEPEMVTPDGRTVRPHRKQKVLCDTIDNISKSQGIEKIHFLKIDVEGFELAVLQGAEEMLHTHSIDVICFEISENPLKAAGVQPKQIVDILTNHGYKIYALQGPPYAFRGPMRDISCFQDNFYASYRNISQNE